MVSGNTPGPSHAHFVTIPCIVFFAVTPIFLGVRIWSRFARSSGMGWDDWTILVSFACTLVVQILMMISVEYGFGQHIYNLSDDNKSMALETFYIAQIFYKLTINLTKISILLLYLRIFLQRWFRICCYILMGIIVSYTIATTCAAIWQCTPIKGAWDKSVQPTCISLSKNWAANAGFSIATDILIILLPTQPLWVSNLPTRQKVALLLVFALGGFGTVTSILRSTTLDFSITSPDTTYDITSTLWTMIEENIGIICACLPMCRLPLAILFPFVFGTVGSDSNRYGSGPEQRSPRGPWSQFSGGPKNRGASHSTIRHNDDESEEYILNTVHGKPTGGGSGDGDVAAIRKTVQYNVSYEVRGNTEV